MLKRKRLPIILQSEMAECGLACLAMILGFYNCELSLSQIRRSFKSTLKGITLYQLKKIAESFSMTVNILRIDLNQLTSLQLPCIVHWDMNHFMVVKKIVGTTLIVHDPARGVRTITFDQVNQSFTGIALEMIPQPTLKLSKPEQKQSTLMMIALLKKYGVVLAKLVIISCLIQIFYIGGVKFIQQCIDSASDLLQYRFLSFLLLAFVGTKLMEVCATAIRALMVTSVGTLINQEFGMAVMKHLLSLPTSFFENRHVGDVLSRFGAIEKIRSTLTEGLAEGLVDGLVSLITLVAMCFYSVKMALIVTTTSVLYFLSRLYYNIKARQHQEEALHARSTELSHFMETVRAIPSIKIFSKDADRLTGWAKKFTRSLNATTRIAWHKIIYDSAKNLLYGLDLALTLFIGCILIANRHITLGMLYAFLAYRQQFTTAISSLVDKMQEYRLLKLHLDRLDDVVSEPSELKNNDKNCHHDDLMAQGALHLENVCFTYAMDETPVLQNIDLVINPHECVAITGASGCGKTTLLKIMMGLLPPTHGQLRLNTTAIYPKHVLCYRKNIAGVLQDDVLFSGTIRDNISFFDPAVDNEKVYRCAKLAGIDEEINDFPMGFDTLIGDMGSVLSGGQKQRVLLARALYVQPAILFLDEASSHLDSKKEREVNEAIRSLGITVVLIAHRQETIKMADRVIYLQKVTWNGGHVARKKRGLPLPLLF